MPSDLEYGFLKRLCDGAIDEQAARKDGGEGIAALLGSGFTAAALEARFKAMMRRVVAINREGLAMGLNLLIFPQGTRSIRLTRGHTGAAQVALHTGAPVIPIGCNGSDQLYPGNSPWSRSGTVRYRIGEPLTVDNALRPFAIDQPFTPFTRDAERHEPTFRKLTDLLMDRIDALLDPPYRYGDVTEGKGASRFV
ncbi:MAG: 1-acyl-sn-glycerol-3-phosphate acyltransferase [Myxococcales bacterium]|nr:1-acyl-sn-glycerol-3-phosphate acyltransferase [Myxococcales bacterium]